MYSATIEETLYSLVRSAGHSRQALATAANPFTITQLDFDLKLWLTTAPGDDTVDIFVTPATPSAQEHVQAASSLSGKVVALTAVDTGSYEVRITHAHSDGTVALTCLVTQEGQAVAGQEVEVNIDHALTERLNPDGFLLDPVTRLDEQVLTTDDEGVCQSTLHVAAEPSGTSLALSIRVGEQLKSYRYTT